MDSSDKSSVDPVKVQADLDYETTANTPFLLHKYTTRSIRNIATALERTFLWASTVQGHDAWAEVAANLRQMARDLDTRDRLKAEKEAAAGDPCG